MSTSIFHPLPKDIIDFKLLVVRCVRITSKRKLIYSDDAWFHNINEKLQIRWHYKRKLVAIRLDDPKFKQGNIFLCIDLRDKCFLYSITNTWVSGFGADAWNEQLSESDLKITLKRIENDIIFAALET